ncbi:MAG: helix-turn-helix domain-containing protein [Phycisphaerae bacterium]|nr:helix-turn-helix domain-containing protein [Phycisphaerae bacterium]
MAKMFYTIKEVCEKLSMSEDQIKDLVRNAKLREFRDVGKVNYKVEDVDALAKAVAADSSGGSGSGELVLEPAEESTIDLAMSATSDVISLEAADLDGTAAGEKSEEDKKDDTVVTSVGISVFDEEDADGLDGIADPLAQTVVSGAGGGGLGIEGVGSGSGLLDLTRESDDTSLGAELLDEIYPGEPEEGAEMGDATRAGLEDVIAEGPEDQDMFEGSGVSAAASAPAKGAVATTVVTRVEYAPDAMGTGLTGLLVITIVVMVFAGVTAAASVRGVSLPMIEFVYDKLWMFGAGAVVVGVIATVIGLLLGKRG